MLSSNIHLLDKFGLTWTVLPYFASADRSFLLLTQLYRKSREMLDENFEAILNWLIGTATWIEIIDSYNENMLFLPCNLFRFSFCLNSESCTKSFIELIKRIDDEKGYYFNDKFMHSRLCIDRLELCSDFIEILYPSIDLLMQTTIICFTNSNINIKLFERVKIIDKLSLIIEKCKSFNEDLLFSHLMNKNLEWTNSIFDKFKMISISLRDLSEIKAIDIFNFC